MSDATAKGVAYHKAIAATLETMQAAADAIARDFQEDNAAVLAALGEAVTAHFAAGRPSAVDSRTASWRCRIRLYDANRTDGEPFADSDDGLPADKPGTWVISGLPNVAAAVRDAANAAHGSAIVLGLSDGELARRLRGLRPTLSRNKGSAVWRIPYTVVMPTIEPGWENRREWLARVDIQRETKGESNA